MRIHAVATASLLIASAAAFTSCAKVQDSLPSSVTTAVSRDFNQGNAARTAAEYTDDAQILPPHHPLIEGKPDITAFFASNIDKYIGFGTETTWSVVRDDVGVEQGVYRIRNVRIGQDVETGKYIRIWKRKPDGWKVYRDMFSPDTSQAEAVYVSPEGPAPVESVATK